MVENRGRPGRRLRRRSAMVALFGAILVAAGVIVIASFAPEVATNPFFIAFAAALGGYLIAGVFLSVYGPRQR